MNRRRSRYDDAQLFAPRADGSTVFEGGRPRRIDPAAGVIEHVVVQGDRLDLLAKHYYDDESLWWRIVDANPSFSFAGDMTRSKDDSESGESRRPTMIGRKILIPRIQD